MSYTKQMNNAEAIANCTNEFGVPHLTQLNIVVEGTQIKHYKYFELSQYATTHHDFTLINN